MSAGRSSHDSACFSVERTKYLMLSKSMPDRSEPQFGMGLRPKYFSPLSRFSSIHSGSLLRAEMSRTTSSESPRLADAPATSESAQPNLYVPSPSSWSFAVVVICQSPPDSLVSFPVMYGSHGSYRFRRRAQSSQGGVPGCRGDARMPRSLPRTAAGT